MKRNLTKQHIKMFREYLIREEKSAATIEKYLHDIWCFVVYTNGEAVTKDIVLAYKQECIGKYAVRSVNAKLASISCLFSFLGWEDCKVKSLKIQRQVFQPEEKELTKAEYLRLIQAAKSNPRLCLILETICSTGIRVSELQFFTVEAITSGMVTVSCKNKTRNIFVPSKLRKLLLNYTRRYHIENGVVFRTKGGRPVNRSNLWKEMKNLCAAANVNPSKVFPHNLRKLFAQTFYGVEKDIAKLADILGHNSIDTTRIYIMTTGWEHRQKMERLGLIV